MNGNVTPLSPGNSENNENAYVQERHSTFNPSYKLADTYRFGELHPHFVAETVPSDEGYKLICGSEVDTYTLKAPLKNGVKVHRDYFEVPMQAILPFQEDRIYTNPNIGDDVPDDTGTYIEEFDTKISTYLDKIMAELDSVVTKDENDKLYITSTGATETLVNIFNYLIQGEYFYSAGSLTNVLGHSMIGRCTGYVEDANENKIKGWDNIYDYFMGLIFDVFESISYNHDGDGVADNVAYFGDYDNNVKDLGYRNARTFIEDLRDNGGLTEITNITYKSGKNWDDIAYELVKLIPHDISGDDFDWIHTYGFINYNDEGLDIARYFAYQIVCSHFYTNDKIDYVYSAELYRQNLRDCINKVCIGGGDPGIEAISQTLEWNGIYLNYDYCSAHYFNELYSYYAYRDFGKYLSLIFAYRHSLRYIDYFVGSKTRPFAVGDLNVPVTAGVGVNIVDTIRKKWFARFLQAVQRTGRKASNYISMMFPGTNVAYDYHDPMFLGDTQDDLFVDKTQNTSEAQMENALSITANLRSNSNRYGFEFSADREGIIIGITWFDIPRLYSHSTDRTMFHKDRFDKFNPMLEFTGDQPVLMAELTDASQYNTSDTFGYQKKYEEYKQRVSRCCGGFVENLPGYIFQADRANGLPAPKNISPSYIRSSNAEMDEFYLSLTGWSLGTYFHFIIVNDNQCEVKRPMSHNPQIM